MKIKIAYRPFPKEIHGSVFGITKEQNNRFLILIDNENTAEEQDFALRHELSHIALNHFAQTLPIDNVISSGGCFGGGWEQREKDADSLAQQMTVDELMQLCE